MFGINYYFLFEFLGFLSFFMVITKEAYQRNYRQLFEIGSCAVFGMMLEIGNVYLADTYAYSQNFSVNLLNVPVVIGLGWAVIIYCVMRLSDQYNVPWTLRPFMDALMAVIIDLAIDAVAIRLGLWQWSIPLNREWYGVPFENLVGWILVVLSFSFLARLIRTLRYERFKTKLLMLFLPILSYLGLILGLAIFSTLAALPYLINHWSTFVQLSRDQNFAILSYPQVVFWKSIFFAVIMAGLVSVVAWSLVKYRQLVLENFDSVSFLILTGLHIFFLAAIFSTGLNRELPILMMVSLVGLFLHLFLHLLPYLLSYKLVAAKEMLSETQE